MKEALRWLDRLLGYATGGTAVVGGMLAATMLGVFLIPVLYVVVVKLTRKLTWRK